ncbi:MAG TPA: hypothetical protein VFV63_12405 [Ilumatobacteraceae bacterium]|nr:hypothetical protein [Ilumatobacteraceae bacterium]
MTDVSMWFALESAMHVIDDGRVAERGKHAELLAAGGRYADLYQTQFADDFVAAAGR